MNMSNQEMLVPKYQPGAVWMELSTRREFILIHRNTDGTLYFRGEVDDYEETGMVWVGS